MATEKGWNGWLNWVLGLLHFICNKKFKYVNHIIDIDYKWSDNQYSCALLLRVFYGGMKGDMILLKNCAKIIEKFDPEELETNTLEIKLIKPNYNMKIIRAAADFHCVPGIIKNILKIHPNYTDINVKKAIWDYSSSIRFDCELNKQIIYGKILEKRYTIFKDGIYLIYHMKKVLNLYYNNSFDLSYLSLYKAN